MPSLTKATPKYRKHKASGQAVVSIEGRDFYLGPYGSTASKIEYDRIVVEWLAAGRHLPIRSPETSDLTVVEMLARFRSFALKHYRKNGRPTGEWENIERAIEPVKRLYGRTFVRDFGPVSLKAARQEMIDSQRLSRSTINSRVRKIRRVFRWAVSEGIAPSSLVDALETVEALQKDRTDVREAPPVTPVPDEVVERTLPHLPEVVADMVRFQRRTACRPGEVCVIRPRDVDRSRDPWRYVPESHKTEHQGQRRVIFVGPRAQAFLLPYLLRDPDGYCFSPVDTDRKRKAKIRAARKTRVQPSQRDRSKKHAKRKPGPCYTTNSYGYAIRRASDKAGVERWGPNRLRHAAASWIRSRFGLEAAQVILGHARADISEVYAERDMRLAADIIREIG
jgi:integrase